MAENEDRELRKLQKGIRRDQREIEKMLKELERYADIFRDASRYLSSLNKAETWRLPDDYPLPREILQKHFDEFWIIDKWITVTLSSSSCY